MEVLQKPYTVQEIKKITGWEQNRNGYITGRVAVPLSDIINSDFEQFLDLIAIKLVNNDCLMNIDYTAVGIEDVEESGNANIIIEVTGDASEIIAEAEED